MDIKSVLVFFAFAVVSARTTCKTYDQVNKENIRNCLDEKDGNDDRTTKENNTDEIYHISNLVMKLTNETLSISFKPDHAEGRKMKTSTSNLIQYALIPAFFMSGVMPWIMPKLQMAVMVVSMVNNMVFTSALFSLVRNFVFDKKPDEHVIYVNNGYKNKLNHHRRTGQ
ncbi:unnamed protein product [Psylliodes chrysocephalus]|uniref:Uncharacterized protein n=1 Tax=Psylliodes chrysocephalus TaxID=3402493 RepID=A0A9P0G345_9CUCU|nr:unnamed protein product [Psylliodes chrysocephala]